MMKIENLYQDIQNAEEFVPSFYPLVRLEPSFIHRDSSHCKIIGEVEYNILQLRWNDLFGDSLKQIYDWFVFELVKIMMFVRKEASLNIDEKPVCWIQCHPKIMAIIQTSCKFEPDPIEFEYYCGILDAFSDYKMHLFVEENLGSIIKIGYGKHFVSLKTSDFMKKVL